MAFRPSKNDPITKSGKLFAEKFSSSTPRRRLDPNPENTPSRSSRAQDPEGFLAYEVPSRLTVKDEATGANLAHMNDRTPLLFDSADDVSTTKPGKSVTAAMTSNEKGKNDEGVTNGAATNLTNDEESLLDRYRQYSQSDRTKLRLTCLSPQGEVQESRKIADQDSRAKPNLEAAATSSVNNTKGMSSLSMEEKERASKYRKMLKMGIPPDAVRHKMISDEIQPTIMSAVLDDSTTMNHASESTKKENATECSELTSEEEVLAEKYRKMLRMGVPLDGVKHKMAMASVDLKILSVVLRAASPSSVSAEVESDNTRHVKMSTKIDVPSLLSDEEEAVATTYRKMLKICVPKEAVRHKMKQDGIISKIVEAVLGKDSTEVAGSDSTSFQTNSTNRKTIALYWTASNLDPELFEQSIFGRTELRQKLAVVNPEESEIKKLEEIFQKHNSCIPTKIKTGSQDDGGNGMAKLLELIRANNVAICLKRFNDFTFRSLAETIGDLDPDRKIVGERVQFLPSLLPTPNEIQAIKTYKGDEDKLITAELFFRQLVLVKRIEDKVKAMQAMVTFEERVEEARAGLKTLQEVCSQVMNSKKLIQVLDMVLNIGNLMNAGTLHGGVEAIKFESLSKLSETKSADGKTTVLDYIIQTFIEKGERQALFLMSEFPSIQDSSRLSIGDLMNDMISLRNDYKLCAKELSSMKRDQRSKGLTKTSTIANGNKVEDPRRALFAAISSRGSKEDDTLKLSPGPRKALFTAITKKKVDNDDESDDDTSVPGVAYTPGVHRLQRFFVHSKSILSIADEDLDFAIRACKGLAVYCGEDGGERAAASLLQVLSSFALSLESGVKKYDQRVEAEKKRAARRKNNDKGKENNHNTNSVSTTRLLKSSSFQPHVGLLDEGKGLYITTFSIRESNPMNSIFNAIKERGAQSGEGTLPGSIANSVATISNIDSRQALLASIKNRRGSLPNKPSPDGVPDRIKHINNITRKESRVLLVNMMLSNAPPSVKQDFLKGVTYKETDDPLLKKIYDKESNADGDEEDANVGKNWKSVDPRQELFAAIKGTRSND